MTRAIDRADYIGVVLAANLLPLRARLAASVLVSENVISLPTFELAKEVRQGLGEQIGNLLAESPDLLRYRQVDSEVDNMRRYSASLVVLTQDQLHELCHAAYKQGYRNTQGVPA